MIKLAKNILSFVITFQLSQLNGDVLAMFKFPEDCFNQVRLAEEYVSSHSIFALAFEDNELFNTVNAMLPDRKKKSVFQ